MANEIPLLTPTVLRGVVEKLTAPEELTLINRFPKESYPFSNVAVWDVIRGSRTVAGPNVPNSEAHIVPRLGRAQQQASMIYMRDKKVFEPTTMRWLRTPGQIAATNAEAMVMREINDLNTRFDNFVELSLWGCLSGNLNFNFRDVVAAVDFQMPASHKVTPGTGWNTATPQQIIADIVAWRKLIRRDGRVKADEVFTTEAVMTLIFNAFTKTAAAGAGTTALLLSDRMKDQYFSNGTIPGFMELNWQLVDSVYTDTVTGTLTDFVPANALYMGNYTQNSPIKILEGPTADLDAPDGFTGRFMKSREEFDPSARQILLEYSFMPVVERPEQMVYAVNVY